MSVLDYFGKSAASRSRLWGPSGCGQRALDIRSRWTAVPSAWELASRCKEWLEINPGRRPSWTLNSQLIDVSLSLKWCLVNAPVMDQRGVCCRQCLLLPENRKQKLTHLKPVLFLVGILPHSPPPKKRHNPAVLEPLTTDPLFAGMQQFHVKLVPREPCFDSSFLVTLLDWIILAAWTLVLPFAETPLMPTSSSPLCKVPSFAAGVLSNTCRMKGKI